MSEEQKNTDNNHRAIKIIREVNIAAEDFYLEAVQIGDHAAFALKRIHRSQMTGLENIAESALKTSDIFDYIKRQTARFSYWRQNFRPNTERGELIPPYSDTAFGERLKDYLEVSLAEKRDQICSPKRLGIGNKTDEEKQERRHVYLLLIRQFVRQMVIQYEYRVSLDNEKKGA